MNNYIWTVYVDRYTYMYLKIKLCGICKQNNIPISSRQKNYNYTLPLVRQIMYNNDIIIIL